ncbi:MAG: PaaI family thioesterase [Gammaproteobacteria bacterium]|nr:PaaI family thioesterase [Gammaproteobacteria bacterium]
MMSSEQPDDSPDWLAYPRAMAGPIYEYLGLAITDGGSGWLEVTLTITEQLLNKDGVLHGGMWTVIADAAMGGACRTWLKPTERVVTMQMDFRWLKPLTDTQLRGVGRVLNRTQRIWYCTVELFGSADSPVGFGSATFMIMPYQSAG